MQLPSDADCTGRNFGQQELDLLKRAIECGTLNCTKGTLVKEFEDKFKEKYGVEFCRTTTSGTASIHTAIAGDRIEQQEMETKVNAIDAYA